MSADWGPTLRAMIPVLESGFCDDRQMQRLVDDLDSRPETILPHSVGLCQYVAFLCAKIGRATLARRILYANLHWELTASPVPADVATTISNIRSVDEILGDAFSDEQIRRRALDRSYRDQDEATRIE
jgi:hypothetical protein